MSLIYLIGDMLRDFYQLFLRPAYDQDPKELPMNKEPYEEPVEPVLTSREQLLMEAKRWLGEDASPENRTNNELACAESVSHIIKQVFPDFVGSVSTAELDYFLDKSVHFFPTRIPKPGNVIVSPRTTKNNGHTGLFLTPNRIASNTSATGKFEDNYSLDSWAREMRDKRGLHIYMYEAT